MTYSLYLIVFACLLVSYAHFEKNKDAVINLNMLARKNEHFVLEETRIEISNKNVMD